MVRAPKWQCLYGLIFFQEVYKDKTLGIDPRARFVQPAGMKNEMLQGWDEVPAADTLMVEGDNNGSGDASQYIDVPVSDGREKVSTESKLTPEEEVIKQEAQKAKKDDKKNDSSVQGEKKRGFFKRLFGGRKKD